MMEADLVHATSDQLFKSTEIYVPSDYVVHMRQARPGQRYDVKFMTNQESFHPSDLAGKSVIHK